MLEVKKIYIDTRFKTDDSISNTDFYIDLPKTVNLDNVRCYIDDIVIPVSFKVVEEYNSKMYFTVFYYTGEYYITKYHTITLPPKNYNGVTLSYTLQTLMNLELVENTNFKMNVEYDFIENVITMSMIDLRQVKTGDVATINIIPDYKLLDLHNWNVRLNKDEIKSINQILRITKTIEITNIRNFQCDVDLHTTRNLYLHSSVLNSYNIISNFNMDTIIKKIPVRANYGEMIFDGATDGFDYLDISRRSLNRIDFRLSDSFGNTINLHNNHWSFSLVFVE